MDFDRVWRRRLTDCLRMFTGCRGRGLRIVYGCLPDVEDEAYGLFKDFYRIWGRWGGGLRIASGFLSDLVEEAYGLFTDFYRIWGRRLADCARMFTGFGGRRLMDFYRNCMEEEPYGLCTDVYRIWGRRLTDCLRFFYRIWGRRLTDCLRILTECKGGGLQIAYGFLPDLGEEAYGLFTDFDRM